jgi:hypothetical protein
LAGFLLATDCRRSALWHRRISAASADARRHMRITQGPVFLLSKSLLRNNRHATNLPIVGKKYSKLARIGNIGLDGKLIICNHLASSMASIYRQILATGR